MGQYCVISPGQFEAIVNSLAWEAMKSRYADDRKTKYKDWRRTFLNAVKGNWFKLWYATDDGFALTTAGKQKQREVEAMKEAA